MIGKYYTLDAEIGEGRVPIQTEDVKSWAAWFERDDTAGTRTVGKTEVGPHVVSTTFLGVSHQFDQAGPPVLFETMVFWIERDEDEIQHEVREFENMFWRGVSWEDAAWNHIETVRALEDELDVDSGLKEAIEAKIGRRLR